MIKEIKSRANQYIVDLAKLKDSKTSKLMKKYLIEGEHLYKMAKNSRYLVNVLCLEKRDDLDEKIDQILVTKEILEKLSSNKSVPEIISVCDYFDEKIDEENILIYLDNIQDPGNLGTILRSCLAFSFKNILLSSDCVNIYNQKVIQSSQGAMFGLNFKNSSYDELVKYKKRGYKIISTSLGEKSVNLQNLKLNKEEKVIFVFGNEGQGVRKEILDISDEKLFIEMDNIDSLNVGVATSIVLYQIKQKF